MKTIDLHVHSTFSDGTVAPADLVEMACQTGLSAMALTDHDTTAGIPEAIEAASHTSLELIPGIELSTIYNDRKEIHIVGLFIDYQNQHFNDTLEHLRQVRQDRNRLMVERFKQFNIDISLEEMNERYGNAVITRAHFADYLLDKGYIKSRKEAFDRYIGDNGPCFVMRRKMTCDEAIKLIRSTGGVPILAHPTLYHLGTAQMRQLLASLTESGLIGMECIYSTFSLGDEIQMRKFASEFGLIISGGSDYHGSNKPNLSLGTGRGKLCVPYDILEPIKKNVAAI